MNMKLGKHIILLTLVFIASMVGGFYHAHSDVKAAKEKVKVAFQEFEFIKKASPLVIFAFIFLNNSIKAVLATATGIFFGIFPLSFIAINGYLIGLVVYVKGIELGYGRVLLYLLPHGILEIPAILLACSYGMWLGERFVKKLRGAEINLRNDFRCATFKCLKNVVPVLLIAAAVETFITPLIASA